MYGMSIDFLVPALLCVIVTGVVDAARVQEDSPFIFNGFSREGVCPDDAEILLSIIPVWVYVVHG